MRRSSTQPCSEKSPSLVPRATEVERHRGVPEVVADAVDQLRERARRTARIQWPDREAVAEDHAGPGLVPPPGTTRWRASRYRPTQTNRSRVQERAPESPVGARSGEPVPAVVRLGQRVGPEHETHVVGHDVVDRRRVLPLVEVVDELRPLVAEVPEVLEPRRPLHPARTVVQPIPCHDGGVDEPAVVVVEDDMAIAGLVDMYLRRAGYRPLLASTGHRGLELISQQRPVLAVLDVGLPDLDGFELCRRIRAAASGADLPVLFLTGRDEEVDRLEGFALGADDYVVKPFSPPELVARSARSSPARRRTSPVRDIVEIDGIEVDGPRREVRVDGRPVALATREFDLLAFLARNRGLALSRRQLLDGVWGLDWDGDERTVDVHVAQLRRKLSDRLPLATVWGVGYRLG